VTGLDEVDIIFEYALGTAYLGLFALEFQGIAVQKTGSEVQFVFEQPYILVASAEQRFNAARDLNRRLH
jgi:hypothetical protein